MSETYELVCHATRQRLWVGQGRQGHGMEIFYSGEPETLDLLKRFLAATVGYELILLCTDRPGQNDDWLDYEEFKGVAPSSRASQAT